MDTNQDRLQQYHAYCDNVKLAARGQWAFILGTLCHELDEALERLGKHVPCPSHGGKDGFRLIRGSMFDDCGMGVCNSCNGGKPMDGYDLINWLKGYDYHTTIKEVGRVLGMEWSAAKAVPVRPVTSPPPPVDRTAEIEAAWVKAGEKIDKVLSECQKVDWRGDNPVTRYFRLRGLELIFVEPPKDLLFHPGLAYWDTVEVDGKTGFRKLGEFPTMIAIMRDLEGKVVTLHRTYLDADGYKADVPSARKVMSPRANMTGASIALYDHPGGDLIVGEGIETILSAYLANRASRKRPSARSLYNTTLLAGYTTPEGTKRMVVYGDNDPSQAGEKAGQALLARHPQVRARLVLPPIVGEDWNDHYCRATRRPSPSRSNRRPRAARQAVAAGEVDESERETEVVKEC